MQVNIQPGIKPSTMISSADYKPSGVSRSLRKPEADTAGAKVDQLKPSVSTLVNDGNLHASRVFAPDPEGRGQAPLQRDSLVLETGDGADKVDVCKLASGQLEVVVNGKYYAFNATDAEGEPLRLQIKTKGGRDNITIDAAVMNDTTVEAGDGNDEVRAGGGTTRLFGGKGDDTLTLGSGIGYAEGNEGNDLMYGGSGNLAMYGNDGDDRMYARFGDSHKKSYMDGGNGADSLYGGNGHTVMSGGNGNDIMAGHDRTTFYTGRGANTVWSHNSKDVVYATPNTQVNATSGTEVVTVKPGNFGIKGFNVTGTEQFIQRFQDDLAFYNSSPTGQKMLAELDAAAERNGAPIKVLEETNIFSSSYSHASNDQTSSSKEQAQPPTSSKGYIINDVAGLPITNVQVNYNRSAVINYPDYNTPPVGALFHELAHAYNAVNGTFLPGKYSEVAKDGSESELAYVESQAIGFATDAKPFDFDGDPSTPPSSVNPKPFTENGMREEMRVDLRQHY